MSWAQICSLFAGAILSLIFAFDRKESFRISCWSVFLWSHVIFVVLGVLLAPWILDGQGARLFEAFNLSVITSKDLCVANGIATGGLLLAWLSHVTVRSYFPAKTNPSRKWNAPLIVASGKGSQAAKIVIAIFVAMGFLIWGSKLDVFVYGVIEGYFLRSPSDMYNARESFQELGLPYYLLVLNALPFLTVFAILRWRRGEYSWALTAMLAAFATIFFQFALFEKRPLIVLLGTIWATFFLFSNRVSGRRPQSLGMRRYVIGIFVVTSLFGLLLMLYRMALPESSGFGLWALSEYVGARVVGRLSLPVIFYAHCFPDVFPHYGITNIGKLGFIYEAFGYTEFPDTIHTIVYFTGNDWGSGAIGALGDFYGAFSWAGVILGAISLGVLLCWLDWRLSRMAVSSANGTLWIFSLIFSYYLSQGSFPRCLSTYGGATFLLLWMLFSAVESGGLRVAILSSKRAA